MRITVTGLLLLLIAPLAYADWQDDFARAIEMPQGKEQDRLIARIVRAAPDIEEVVELIEMTEFPSVETAGLILDSTACLDGRVRPWVLYVPPGYEPRVPSPLLVRLHGGVGRAEITEDPVGYAEADEWLPVAEKHGWLVLYPFGQSGATWWDKVGMANVSNLIRTVKRGYNIDDDRVWMAGFSDGGSAGFTWAMVQPNDLAAVVALNGHMGVGSLDGSLPLHAVNLANIPLYAVTTKQDELYPSDLMRSTIAMALEAGADILYREFEGTHDLVYAETELPRITSFLLRHPRDPFPASIIWEAGRPEYGGCRWIVIDEITTDKPAAWHEDHNIALVDSRVTIGFVHDESFEGRGVRVSNVIEESAAEEMGLADGDVITRCGNMEIGNLDDLLAFKSTLQRGDPFELTVLRGSGVIVLEGSIPPPANYYLFKREVPSGLVRADFLANRIDIETSRVGALSVLVHPDMISQDEVLTINWNGLTVYQGRTPEDLEYMIRNFMENRDRKLLYTARISLRAPEVQHELD